MTLGDIKEKSRRYDLGLVADDYFEKQGQVLFRYISPATVSSPRCAAGFPLYQVYLTSACGS